MYSRSLPNSQGKFLLRRDFKLIFWSRSVIDYVSHTFWLKRHDSYRSRALTNSFCDWKFWCHDSYVTKILFFVFAWIRVSEWWWLHVVQSREIFRSPDDVKIWTRPSQTSFSIFILFSTMLFSGPLLAFLANPILTLFDPKTCQFSSISVKNSRIIMQNRYFFSKHRWKTHFWNTLLKYSRHLVSAVKWWDNMFCVTLKKSEIPTWNIVHVLWQMWSF